MIDVDPPEARVLGNQCHITNRDEKRSIACVEWNGLDNNNHIR